MLIDDFLNAMLPAETGYYVHVGAGDGKAENLNLTYALYKRGWRGLCIEPYETALNKGKRTRPKDTWIHAAIVKQSYLPTNVTYQYEPTLKFAGLTVTPFDAKAYYDMQGRRWEGFKEITVPAAKLNAILQEHDCPKPLDLLVLDCNGSERDALSTFAFDLWRPHLIVCAKGDTSVELLAKAMGWFTLHSTPFLWVFSNNEDDRVLVANFEREYS